MYLHFLNPNVIRQSSHYSSYFIRSRLMKWFNLKMSLFELLLIDSIRSARFSNVRRSLLYFLHSYGNSELSLYGVKEGLLLAS